MVRTKTVVVSLLLLKSSLFVVCLPYGARNDRQAVGAPYNQPPGFFMDLFHCWRDKNEFEEPPITVENCFRNAGEDDDAISEILLSDKLVGFEGQVPSTNTAGPEYLVLSFNLSDANPSDTTHSSELRVYKHNVSQTVLNSLSSGPCDLNVGIDMALLASPDGTGTNMQTVKTVTITHADLLVDTWIRFSNLTELCDQWVNNALNMDNMTVKLKFVGSCVGISPVDLGFRTEPDTPPMLLAFQETLDTTYLSNFHLGISKRDIEKRELQLCALENYTVNFSQTGLQFQPGHTVISPATYQPNYCLGHCRFPIPGFINASLHAQIQAFLHTLDATVPDPCCAVAELSSIVVLEQLSDMTVVVTTYNDVVATKCVCA